MNTRTIPPTPRPTRAQRLRRFGAALGVAAVVVFAVTILAPTVALGFLSTLGILLACGFGTIAVLSGHVDR